MSNERIPMSREGYDKLKAELDRLQHAEMLAVTKRIATAREHGDLSENAEYHAAREDQGMLQARIDAFKDKLARAYFIDRNSLPTDSVVFGARVRVKDLDLDEEETFELVGPGDEDYNNNKILTISPIGQGLIGKKAGEVAEIQVPMGKVRFEIIEIFLPVVRRFIGSRAPMTDPRLNSVHLEFPRREEFRRARCALLDARGDHTLAGEDLLKHRLGGRDTLLQQAQSPGAHPTDFWLISREGIYPLKVGVNTIGRLQDNDVVLHGPYVSRRHCAILVHANDGCELYDIASKNGTFLNGAKLDAPSSLHSGDEIRMCDLHLIFMTKHGPHAGPGNDATQAE